MRVIRILLERSILRHVTRCFRLASVSASECDTSGKCHGISKAETENSLCCRKWAHSRFNINRDEDEFAAKKSKTKKQPSYWTGLTSCCRFSLQTQESGFGVLDVTNLVFGCHQFGCLQVTNDIFDVTQYPLTMLAISHPLTNQRPRLPWGASQRHSSVIESSPPSSSFQTKPTLSRVRSISNFLLSSHLFCSRQGA